MIITENFLDFDDKYRYPQGDMASGDSNCYSLAIEDQPVHAEPLNRWGYQHFLMKIINYQSVCTMIITEKSPRFW